ncbi:MAG: S4 domain-containing protein, partial [Cyanobacteria bacterium P01_H01_bin.119]
MINLSASDSQFSEPLPTRLHLTVESGLSERLDSWLAQQLPDYSRSRLQKLIEAGQVRVNQQVCTQKKSAVQPGDAIALTIPAAEPLDLVAEAIPLDILYEDAHLLIINKPAG